MRMERRRTFNKLRDRKFVLAVRSLSRDAKGGGHHRGIGLGVFVVVSFLQDVWECIKQGVRRTKCT